VARAALERGWRVRALRRRPGATGNIGDLEGKVAWVEGDLEDRAAVEAAMRGCHTVFHVAGYYPGLRSARGDHVAAALRQMRNVIAAAQATGVACLVYTSSLSTIGWPARPDGLATEADWYRSGQSAASRHPYWEVKLAQEQEALRASAELPIVILNPTAVFGPGDVKLSSGQAIIAALRLRCFFSLGGRINVVDVRDVAQAHVAAAERGRAGERTILGGHNVTVDQVVRALAHAAGLPPPRVRIPLGLLYAPAWFIEHVILRLFPRMAYPPTHSLDLVRKAGWYDCGKAQRELGLQPRPLQETFDDAVAWFREHDYV
jgi:dihydroflavonol-4-reductase